MKFGPPLTTENLDRLKCQLQQISYEYIYTYDFLKQKHILSKEEWEVLTAGFAKRSCDSIIITKPDKGNGVVIVNKLDYLNKMKLLVSDETKFKKLTQNPTNSREDSLISYLRKLKTVKIIKCIKLCPERFPSLSENKLHEKYIAQNAIVFRDMYLQFSARHNNLLV